MSESLFSLPLPEQPIIAAASRYQALGTAAEYAAIAVLLEAGHKVAVPVTDDDGVDIIVNYRTTVQVKSSGKRADSGALHLNLHTRRSAERVIQRRSHVDVYVIRARDTGEWWVIPREAMTPGTTIQLGPAYDQWRDAWTQFGEGETPASISRSAA